MKNHDHSHHKGNFEKKVASLDNAKRREEFPPEQLLKQFPINANDTILDIGAGTGFLTIPAAKATEGLVYALDIDPKMLQIIRSKADEEGLKNIRTIKEEMKDLPLSTNSMDIVLASLVLHEINPLPETLQFINQVLKIKGTFVCVELEKEENPSQHHPRIASAEMEQQLNRAGFEVTKKYHPTDAIYVIIAQKKD